MAKRLIDTDIFKKSFTRSLTGAYKLLFIYIINDCNHAGIWDVDLEIAGMRCGFNFDEETAKKEFGDKIIIFDSGKKWFIPSFVSFQYGELNSTNKAHNSVIQILKKYSLNCEIKPLPSPLVGAKDKDKDMVKDKDITNTPVNFQKEGAVSLMQRLWINAGLYFDEGEKTKVTEVAQKILTPLKDLGQITQEQFSILEKETCKIIEFVKQEDNVKYYGSFTAINNGFGKIKNSLSVQPLKTPFSAR